MNSNGDNGQVDREHALRLSKLTLLRVAFRSLFLETSWNHRGQQNLGYLGAVDPALNVIYRDDSQKLNQARLRALGFFNTNPTVSGLVIGASLRLEQSAAEGCLDDKRRITLINALASAMAAQGDRLFWFSWLPLCCLVAVLSYYVFDWFWAPLLVPVLFTVVSWAVRFGGVFVGYRQGLQVHRLISRYKVEFWVKFIRFLTITGLGLLTILLWHRTLEASIRPHWRTAAAALSVMGLVMAYNRLLIRNRLQVSWFLYPLLLALTAAVGVFLL
ncbi:MAG: PTS system mannose/fructose/sorbose family transporter subunit IID [Deltaproteobacteria bacterium]|jgi:mannose/fructose/N-acetylgalactosamine-specific phosphotransferase system component IID|nr:PTS system mannose/fructose/sorbose family transporter subunit IID [Deltaproteobacteria bacterium]